MSKLANDVGGNEEYEEITKPVDTLVSSRAGTSEYNLAIVVHGFSKTVGKAQFHHKLFRWENSRTHKIVAYSNETTEEMFEVG